MTAGRPKKSDKERKSAIITSRLTEDQKADIIALFGTVDEFLRVAIVTLIKKKGRDK